MEKYEEKNLRTIPTKYRYEENLKSEVLWHWLAQFSDNPWTTEAIKQINNERNAPDRVASSVVLSSVTERDHLKVTISYCKVSRCLAIMVITRDSLGAYLHFSHTHRHTLATKCRLLFTPARLTNWLTMWLTLDDITHNRNQTLTRLEHSVLLMSVLLYFMLWVFGFWFSVFCFFLFGVSARSTCISVASSKTIWYLAQHLSVVSQPSWAVSQSIRQLFS